MPLPTPTESPSCVICSRPLADGLTIPTTSGGTVHVRCAERQARGAARRRTLRAGITAALLAGLLAMTAALGIAGWGLGAEFGGLRTEGWGVWAVLAVLLIAAHILINRRWWHYTVQSARLWWRWK